MANQEKELALSGDTEKELDKKAPEEEQEGLDSDIGVADIDVADGAIEDTADASQADKANDNEEDADEVDEEVEYPEPSRLEKVLSKLPAIPEHPIAKPDPKSETEDEDEDEDDVIEMSASDEEFLFSLDDPMIEPPTVEDMEELAGVGEDPDVLTQEEQEAKDKAELEGLEREEKEEAALDEHLFGTETDGTAGSNEPPIKTTKYTVALNKARNRRQLRTGEDPDASLSSMNLGV